MYIFTQIGFLRNTYISIKEMSIESQFDFKITIGLHSARRKTHNGIMHVTCDRSQSPLNKLINLQYTMDKSYEIIIVSNINLSNNIGLV